MLARNAALFLALGLGVSAAAQSANVIVTLIGAGPGPAYAGRPASAWQGWGPGPSPAGGSAAQGANVIVTVSGEHNRAAPAVTQSQVTVELHGQRQAITSWQKYSSQDRLDLVLALDDDSAHMASRMADIKSFMTSLPANVALGLVYFHTGTVQIAQAFTFDHARVAQELRAPTGGASPSPYGSLQALLAKWPAHPDRRREMILISDGEEHLGGNNSTNLTFEHAMGQAVAGGVVVYTVYVTGPPEAAGTGAAGVPLGKAGSKFGALATSFNAPNGMANLAELAKETGGQSYAQGTQTPMRFQPFLNEIGNELKSQYRLQFAPEASGSGLVGLKVEIHDLHGAHLTAPTQFSLPAN